MACISVREAAAQVGVSEDTIYALCHQGKFPHVRLSPRRIVIPEGKLNAWLDQQAEQSLTPNGAAPQAAAVAAEKRAA